MDSRLGAHSGSVHNSSTSAFTGFFYAFIPDQDTVVSACSGVDQSGTAVNYLTSEQHSLGISGKTLKQGSFFCVPIGHQITSITLTSGAVVLYKTV